MSGGGDLAFGRDGNLYVVSGNTDQVLEYQGPTGAFPGAFMSVFVSIPNVTLLTMLTFGPDGNLYVCGGIAHNYGQVNRYDGSTGAPIGNGVFVSSASGGLTQPRGIVFDSTGTNMYVVDDVTNGVSSGPSEVLRYQGPNGKNPGAYVEAYITGGQSNLSVPIGLARDAAGNLYVSDKETANVTRFAPSAQASFTVQLDSASTSPISVNYVTADGTATAGTDYTATAGTMTFAPGVTSQTINVPITTVATGGPTKTFTINLSGASGATINRGQATGSILNRQTKFFVVDSGAVKTYEYGSGGTSEEVTVAQNSTDTAPRGDASTAAGTTVWVVDANKTVYVYDNHGILQGSWSAGGLSPNATLTGIATNGTDIWLVDSSAEKVYKYTGAANRLSGSQNAAGSFSLASGKKGNTGNTNPQDIVTDGTSFWVVDGSALKVFKYTLSGSSLGSWSIDLANAHPTGITIDPANVNDIWIVDNGTDKVYQYAGAASRTSGSQNAAATFALNPYETDPQGIADPPPTNIMIAQTPFATSQSVPAEGLRFAFAARVIHNAVSGPVMSGASDVSSLAAFSEGEADVPKERLFKVGDQSERKDSGSASEQLEHGSSHAKRAEALDPVMLDQVFADMV
jgi:sugar lactone lactonase YvrE